MILNGENINGWINFNKPEGLSSFKCIYLLKKIIKIKKIGHAGTLDPLASGVLPIALGEATKTIRFAFESKKTYLFRINWGSETSTISLLLIGYSIGLIISCFAE